MTETFCVEHSIVIHHLCIFDTSVPSFPATEGRIPPLIPLSNHLVAKGCPLC